MLDLSKLWLRIQPEILTVPFMFMLLSLSLSLLILLYISIPSIGALAALTLIPAAAWYTITAIILVAATLYFIFLLYIQENKQINSLLEEIEKCKYEIKELQKTVDTLLLQIKEYEQLINAYDQETKDQQRLTNYHYEQDIKKQKQQIKDSSQLIEDYQQQIEALKQKIHACDQETKDYQRDINYYCEQKTKDHQQDRDHYWEQKTKDYQQKIHTCDQKTKDYQKRIKIYQQYIKNLEQEIKKYEQLIKKSKQLIEDYPQLIKNRKISINCNKGGIEELKPWIENNHKKIKSLKNKKGILVFSCYTAITLSLLAIALYTFVVFPITLPVAMVACAVVQIIGLGRLTFKSHDGSKTTAQKWYDTLLLILPFAVCSIATMIIILISPTWTQILAQLSITQAFPPLTIALLVLSTAVLMFCLFKFLNAKGIYDARYSTKKFPEKTLGSNELLDNTQQDILINGHQNNYNALSNPEEKSTASRENEESLSISMNQQND